MERGAWQATVHDITKSWTRLSDFHFILSCQGLKANFFLPLNISHYIDEPVFLSICLLKDILVASNLGKL